MLNVLNSECMNEEGKFWGVTLITGYCKSNPLSDFDSIRLLDQLDQNYKYSMNYVLVYHIKHGNLKIRRS